MKQENWFMMGLIVAFAIAVAFGFGIGWVVHANESDANEISLWDKAAAIGDSFSGHDITEGHHVEGDWVKWSNADIDWAVRNFIDYRAERYGETWLVMSGSCGNRIVERIENEETNGWNLQEQRSFEV